MTIKRAGEDFVTAGSYESREEAFTYAQVEEVRKRETQAFTDVVAFWRRQLDTSESGRSRSVEALLVSPRFLDALGVEPFTGRWAPGEDRSVCTQTGVLLSYGFWQKQFGGDLHAIGLHINLEHQRFVVEGILPRSFEGVEAGKRLDVVLPCAPTMCLPRAEKGGFLGG